MRTVFARAAGIALTYAMAAGAAGQVGNQPDPPGATEAPIEEDPYPSFDLTLTPAGEFSFQADLKDGPGDVSVSRAGLNLTLNAAATQQLRFGLSTEIEGSWYDFKNATTLIPGTSDPFSDMYLVRISPSAMYHFSQQWAVIGGAIIEIAGESDADVGDSFTGGGFGGARYAFSEDLAVTLGVVVKSTLEDDPYVFPLNSVEWQITPDVRFTTAGPGARITANLDKQWGVFFQGGYQLREYRLDDTNILPEGVVRDRRIAAGVGITWRPLEGISVTLQGGATVWQEFEIDNNAGNEVSETNSKPTPFIGLSADFRF
jgi:hypothetical protein